jgi:hypothetical protein
MHATVRSVVAKNASLEEEFITPPRSEAEITRLLALYAEACLPGCIGSTDGVQFMWWAAPAKYVFEYVGKGGKPSIGYITVGRDLCCQFVSNIWRGKHSDKEKVSFDKWIHELRSDPKFKDRKFTVLGKDGELVELTGLYLLADNATLCGRCYSSPRTIAPTTLGRMG